MSHLDGIGMNALVDDDGRWHPAFPNAPIVLSDVEWDKTRRRADAPDAAALVALHAQGAVTPVPLPHRLTADVEMVASGGHSPGHATVVVRSGGARALFLGHLAVSPMQAAVDRPVALHDDPELGRARRYARGSRMPRPTTRSSIGPLWPAPGAAHVRLRSGRARPRRLTARVRPRAAPSPAHHQQRDAPTRRAARRPPSREPDDRHRRTQSADHADAGEVDHQRAGRGQPRARIAVGTELGIALVQESAGAHLVGGRVPSSPAAVPRASGPPRPRCDRAGQPGPGRAQPPLLVLTVAQVAESHRPGAPRARRRVASTRCRPRGRAPPRPDPRASPAHSAS